MEQRFVFDDVAAEYAAARPAYPAALFDDLVRVAGLRAGSRVLELGCGPGTATAGLLGRGFELTCLEPGPRLAALARARVAGTATTVAEQTFFERSGLFDVVAGQAYPLRLEYRTAEYLTLLQTHSDHRMLAADARARLLEAIGRAIDDAGGVLVIEDEIGFCCGRKR
jgi:SAM-dependent methyltransferase